MEGDIMGVVDEEIRRKRLLVIKKAVDHSPEALKKQIDLMRNKDKITPHPVQQKASADIMDRAGVMHEKRPGEVSQVVIPAGVIEQINILVEGSKEIEAAGPPKAIEGRRVAGTGPSADERRRAPRVLEGEVQD